MAKKVKDMPEASRMIVSPGYRAFTIFNDILIGIICIAMLYPFLYLIAQSFSSTEAIVAGKVGIVPVGFSVDTYKYVLSSGVFLPDYLNTLIYAVIGTVSALVLSSLLAYPLSKPELRCNKFIGPFIIFTMYFAGGMIPNYYNITTTLHLSNNLLALILPGLIGTWNMIVMRTSFKALPASIEESARIDGANDFVILFRIILPCAKATLAVIVLYYAVSYWNNWFNAMIYLKDKNKYPLQLFLREILLANTANGATAEGFEESDMLYLEDVVRYATIIISTLPILCAYPFCQKYFLKGVMMGSVKE